MSPFWADYCWSFLLRVLDYIFFAGFWYNFFYHLHFICWAVLSKTRTVTYGWRMLYAVTYVTANVFTFPKYKQMWVLNLPFVIHWFNTYIFTFEVKTYLGSFGIFLFYNMLFCTYLLENLIKNSLPEIGKKLQEKICRHSLTL